MNKKWRFISMVTFTKMILQTWIISKIVYIAVYKKNYVNCIISSCKANRNKSTHKTIEENW